MFGLADCDLDWYVKEDVFETLMLTNKEIAIATYQSSDEEQRKTIDKFRKTKTIESEYKHFRIPVYLRENIFQQNAQKFQGLINEEQEKHYGLITIDDLIV